VNPRARDEAIAEYDPFGGRSIARVVPTTEAQREVWLAAQMSREASLAYNESVSLCIRGSLDLVALDAALIALTDRHEALRSTISADGLSLLVAERGSLRAEVVDLSDRDQEGRALAISLLRTEAVETSFDMVDGPLFRVTLVRADESQWELILTAHHIVCDGWSFGVLARELMVLVVALSSGNSGAGLPTSESFADFALAQVDEVHLQAAERDTGWWLQRFDDSAPVLDLPVDRPRPAVRNFESAREDLVIDAALTASLRTMSARQGSSLFVTLFSTFSALVARLSGQGDVVVGVPAAGQAAEGRHALVGHCVQLLPVRMIVDLELPFGRLLEEARGRVLDAYEHQTCTFGTLLKKLQIPRDPSRLPLVAVMFNLDAAIHSEDLSRAGLEVRLQSNARRFENFDLFLNASQELGEVVLQCQYNTGLFDAATVRRWLDLFRSALERLAADPMQPVAQVFAPTGADVARLAAFNRTEVEYPRRTRVDELISSQAARTPQRVALSHGDATATYADLDLRSNRLAHALRARGARRGRRVGLCVERGIGMVVAQLAVLKAGAAYVPLDPSYPAERLRFMAEDAGLTVLVADASTSGLLPWPEEQTLRVDADADAIAACPPITLVEDNEAARPEDCAYVIYTSGTTGKPKGVQVPHRAVVNFLCSMREEPGLRAEDRLVAVTTLSFDIAVLELLLPLTVGAEVVLASREQAADPRALGALLADGRATAMQATPGTWRMLLDAGWQGNPGFKALVGGEALAPDLARRLLPMVGQLWNMYGPTETTVWSTCWRVEDVESGIRIGRPIANTSVWILDEHGRRCPIGVPGEIWIGGDGVATGYLNRPELTAERFLPDPFSFAPGARLYRTGDRGRWRADGLLEHLGRNDFQVKVRGFRIELGEIETSLARHPDVVQAVAVTRENTPGDVRLVAYVVARRGALDGGALRDFLRVTLPEYMIPQHFVVLPRIPLLPNGKVDRATLPPPAVGGETARVPADSTPRTETERLLASIWGDLLKTSDFGTQDNFFDIGGHSLLAMQALLAMEAKTGKRIERSRFIFESLGQIARAYDDAPPEPPRPAGGLRGLLSGVLGRKRPS
jgi:amino acid adenylation domain-containing protein